MAGAVMHVPVGCARTCATGAFIPIRTWGGVGSMTIAMLLHRYAALPHACICVYAPRAGGVGPMTIAMLLQYHCALHQVCLFVY